MTSYAKEDEQLFDLPLAEQRAFYRVQAKSVVRELRAPGWQKGLHSEEIDAFLKRILRACRSGHSTLIRIERRERGAASW